MKAEEIIVKRSVSLLLAILILISSFNTVFANEPLSDGFNPITVTDTVYSDNGETTVTDAVYTDSLDVLMANLDKLGGSTEKTKYIVRLKSSETKGFNRMNIQRVEFADVLNAMPLELNEEQVNYILQNDLVETLEIDRPIQIAGEDKSPITPQEIKQYSQTIPWGIHATGAYIANSYNSAGNPIKVAVFDTGINNHPDLNMAGGVSYVDGASDYLDQHGHGTHVAGTIAALNNDLGIVGMNSNVELFAVKVMDADGTGYTSSVIQGVEWAIQEGIQIINMSFVSSEYSQLLHEAIQFARDNGILVVAAAGNIGLGDNTLLYPAQNPEVLAVGAVDSHYHRASFSSTGPELDVVAPGTNILSTTKNGEYGIRSGTSQAAAHVTGVAALLWSQQPELSLDELVGSIRENATSLGHVNEYGSGLVNVAKALGHVNGSIAPMGIEGSMYQSPTQVWVKQPVPAEEINIASYDYVGDGQSIFAGETATVSLKLEGDPNGENIHSQIIIEVYSALNPTQIIETRVINNPQLEQDILYDWHTTANTATGTYLIKYRYPAIPSGTWDDVFVIYVIQPTTYPDTYEPNDTTVSAKLVFPGQSYTSYISSSSDIDYYELFTSSLGEITISANIPVNVDFDLTVYNHLGEMIASSTNGVGQFEQVKIPVTVNGHYYIRLEGYSGQFSNLPYILTLGEIVEPIFPMPTNLVATTVGTQIKLNWGAVEGAISYRVRLGEGGTQAETQQLTYTFSNLEPQSTYVFGVAAVFADGISEYATTTATTAVQELFINSPIDTQLNKDKVYAFNPPTTGMYKIFTGPYQGQGLITDTRLSIYSNSQLTQQIDFNDDNDNSVSSELRLKLNGGQTYYVKLSGYDSEAYARITASVINSTIPFIQLNQPVDINERTADSSTLYVFVPSESGQYRISTDYYGGNLASGETDTIIQVYNSESLNNTIPAGYNDDSRNLLFSEVVVQLAGNVPYYIQVKDSSKKKVYARLQVTYSTSQHTAIWH